MSLVRMVLTRYRCFNEPQEIELRPLTIVLGRNNSGKSALVRAPLIIRTGIHTSSPAPLDLDQIGEDMYESFTDLIYGGRPHGSIGLELTLVGPDGPINLAATVQNLHEYRTQVASEIIIWDERERLRLEWESQEPPDADHHRYRMWYGDAREPDAVVKLKLRGLLPDVPVPHPEAASREALLRCHFVAVAVRRDFPTIRYVGPFRERPQRRYRLPAHPPAHIGVAGERTAGILASDAVRQGGRLVDQVNRALKDLMPGWRVEVVDQAGTYAVLLTRDNDSMRINLADTGTGVAQALPLYVQRAKDLIQPPVRPTLEIVEQPELHLHPAAHGPLAQLYADAVKATAVRFLIETHSETFLLRIRRLIAEGELPANQVAIYFVDDDHEAAKVRRIRVDDDGNLDYWPPGVFAEDYAETRALAAAQLRRETAGAD